MSSCGHQPTGVDSICLEFEPRYLADDEYQAIKPFRGFREWLATFNRKWEARCA